MPELLILLFVAFFFGGIYCAFTNRFTLYCGSQDLWSLFFGVLVPGSIFSLNILLGPPPSHSVLQGVPFALATVSLLYNMYITFKINMLEGNGICLSFFAVFFKVFIVTAAILLIVRILCGNSGRKRRR